MAAPKRRKSTSCSLKTQRRPLTKKTLIRKLFLVLQKQLEGFELRDHEDADIEKNAKLLGALTATLERLMSLEIEMAKTKSQDHKHATASADSETILRALAERFERLAKAAHRGASQKAQRA